MTPKWPGMSDAEWAAAKAVAQGTYRPSTGLVDSMIAEIDALRAMVRQQDKNLAAVQAVSTRQCDEIRGMRRILGPSANVDGERQLNVVVDIISERYRQDCKWGPARDRIDIPDGTGSSPGFDAEAYAAAAKDACDSAFANGAGSFLRILAEEFAEAVAEADPAKLRAELVQVAAVACLWVEVLDIRGAK